MGEFLENVSRYPRYLITFTLGIFYSIYQWIKPLFNNPVTAVAAIGILGGGLAFLYFTLQAMLGLTP